MAGTIKGVGPQFGELELSLFGPGYGECVVAHLGGGAWIVTDSCVANDSGRSVALEYLEVLGLQPAAAVKAIVVSNWHDDHTRGLAGLVEACPKALIVCTEAVKTKDFVTLARVAGQRAMMSTSGITEFAKVLDALLARKKAKLPDVSWATANKTLLRLPPINNVPEIVVTSLSPSDAALTRCKLEIARLIPTEPCEKRRIGVPHTNNTSIVLLIQVGSNSVLLGSDLECTADRSDGWMAILNNPARSATKATVYKVPHHGSHTADDPLIWTQLLAPSPWTLLTPFVQGKIALPTKDDAKRISEQTPNGFATASPRRAKPKCRDAAVERTLKETVRSIKLAQPVMGHIRLRKKIGEADGWRAELFGAARPLSELAA